LKRANKKLASLQTPEIHLLIFWHLVRHIPIEATDAKKISGKEKETVFEVYLAAIENSAGSILAVIAYRSLEK
jgi:hypothetical protein